MKKSVAILIFILSSLSLYGQLPVSKITEYIKNINSFNVLNPQEKVYLHFDNTSYFLGDTIWFKAYVIQATDHKYANISKVLYVELCTPEGNIVKIRKLKIENGQCHGDFLFNENYHSGFYEVRAYTRYMMNWGAEYIFSRVFPVFEKPEVDGDYSKREIVGYKHRQKANIERLSNDYPDEVGVSFYPEGGNLVKDIPGRVAFKVIDNKGENINIKGKLYNRSKEVIKEIETTHQGMGIFDYTSEEGAYIEIENKKRKLKFELPEALSRGYVVNIDNSDNDSLKVRIASNIASGTPVGLSVIGRGKTSYFDTLTIDRLHDLKISKTGMPEGVNRLILFDDKGEILSERSFFIFPENSNLLKAKADKEFYNPFELIEIDIQAENKASFSLSVRDRAGDLTVWNDNIFTNLLLSSEIKGCIDDPAYYFKEEDKEKRRSDLDLLMMVQAWKKYSWEQMAGIEKDEQKHKAEEGIVLEGRVVSKQLCVDSLGLKMDVFLENNQYKTDIELDKDGKFRLLFNDFYGRKPILLYVYKKHTNNIVKTIVDSCKILLNRVFSPELRSYSFYDTKLMEVKFHPLQNNILNNKTTSIDQVQILPVFVIKENSRYESRFAYNVAKEKTDLLDQGLIYPKTVIDYLQKKGVPIRQKHSSNKYTAYGNDVLFLYSIRGKWEDKHPSRGIPYIDLDEVKQIKIYDSSYAYKNIKIRSGRPARGAWTSILVESYNKDDILDYQNQPDIRSTYIEGYSKVKEFYSPDYGKYLPIPGDVDYRRTLYWNPNVETDENGRASVSFYNNSSYTSLIINAEGLTTNGVPFVPEGSKIDKK